LIGIMPSDQRVDLRTALLELLEQVFGRPRRPLAAADCFGGCKLRRPDVLRSWLSGYGLIRCHNTLTTVSARAASRQHPWRKAPFNGHREHSARLQPAAAADKPKTRAEQPWVAAQRQITDTNLTARANRCIMLGRGWLHGLGHDGGDGAAGEIGRLGICFRHVP
jgi:hypothetical protein